MAMGTTDAAGALPVKSATTLVSNNAVDFRGRIADKVTTGGWRAAPFIIVNEVAERMAFYAIAVNMVLFLEKEMHEALPEASTHVTDWVGAAFVLTILGAFLADAYFGRFITILIFSSVYAVSWYLICVETLEQGIVLLTLAASIDAFRPPPCQLNGGGGDCRPATKGQNDFLFGALSLIAIGTGGIKPCISSFGADQFDESDINESRKKYSFFNWFFFALNVGVLIGITLVTYIEDRKGWGWGFGMSAIATVASVAALLSGIPYFRHQRPRGSPFTRFLQVIVAACRNQLNGVKVESREQLFEVMTEESVIHGARKLQHTNQFMFLDKAAVKTVAGDSFEVSRWRLCTVTQVEEFKSFLRVLPIWAATIAFPLAFAQINLFISQAVIMDRHMGGDFTVPPGSVAVFTAVNAVIFVPLYERYGVGMFKRFTGNPRGLTSLQRVGIGLAITVPAFAIAGGVERHRRSSVPTKLTFWWLFPQYFLLGFAEVFTYVGQL
ncbi:protein NRT1/ PTR FAMILY 8.1-like, partial [Phalaenopsis equestris]|uniref:protein NRT1/ PTR FAMILY 8.1-like n=1 Tax=Phalaenopsis equestris TaxID=78828 RepID=UPI0009E31ED4